MVQLHWRRKYGNMVELSFAQCMQACFSPWALQCKHLKNRAYQLKENCNEKQSLLQLPLSFSLPPLGYCELILVLWIKQQKKGTGKRDIVIQPLTERLKKMGDKGRGETEFGCCFFPLYFTCEKNTHLWTKEYKRMHSAHLIQLCSSKCSRRGISSR